PEPVRGEDQAGAWDACERARGADGPESPHDRQRQALVEPVARLLREPRPLEHLEEELEVAHPPAALGDAEPGAPAHPALAERVPLRGGGEERQRLVQPFGVHEAGPRDLAVARKARGEPARHRKTKRVIERRVHDAGIVEAPAGGSPESRHAPGEFRQRTVDVLENLGIVGVRLEKAQRLVETEERPRPPEAPTRERAEEAELLFAR